MRGPEEFGIPTEFEGVDENGVPVEKLETIALRKEENIPETIEQLKQTEAWRKADQTKQMELLTAWQVERASHAAAKLEEVENNRAGSASPRVSMFNIKQASGVESKLGQGKVWPTPGSREYYALSLQDQSLADAAWLEAKKEAPKATGRMSPDRPDVSDRGRSDNREVTL